MIHPSCVIHETAKIADDCIIEPFSIIHADVEIGAGSFIGSHCEIGLKTPLAKQKGLVIPPNSNIRSHSILYEGSHFRGPLTTGHHVTIREGTIAGTHLQVGSYGDVQGDCEIGDHVRLQSNIVMGKHARIGDFVWLFSYVMITNDPHPPSNIQAGVEIGNCAVIAANSVILPGVKIGDGALIGASTLVSHDVPEHTIFYGVPGRAHGPTSQILLQDDTNTPAYPWVNHFTRGYPPEALARMREMMNNSSQ